MNRVSKEYFYTESKSNEAFSTDNINVSHIKKTIIVELESSLPLHDDACFVSREIFEIIIDGLIQKGYAKKQKMKKEKILTKKDVIRILMFETSHQYLIQHKNYKSNYRSYNLSWIEGATKLFINNQINKDYLSDWCIFYTKIIKENLSNTESKKNDLLNEIADYLDLLSYAMNQESERSKQVELVNYYLDRIVKNNEILANHKKL